MAEASEVRLVRCPKCENLLPELPDFSVYQCGGCGTVLRGKDKGPMSDGLLEKSDEEGSSGDTEKGSTTLGGGSEADRENNRIGLHKTKNDDFNELSFNSSSRTENQEVLLDSDRTREVEIDKVGLISNQSDKAGYCDDNDRKFPKILNTNWQRGKGHGMNMNRPCYVDSRVENDLEGFRSSVGSLRPRLVMDQWGMGGNGSAAGRGNASGVAQGERFATFSYPDEGPSSSRFGPFYGCSEQARNCGEQVRNHDKLDEHTRVNLDNHRSELLRKLDELKDQLSKSCDMVEQPMQNIAVDQRMLPFPPNSCGEREAFMPYNSTISYGVSTQPLTRDEHVPGPSYFDRNYGTSRRGLPLQNFYPNSRNVSNDFLGYGDAYQPQIIRKPPHQPPREYLQQPYHEHFPEWYMDFNRGSHGSHSHETFLHQPSCSCSHCYFTSQKAPPKFPPSVFSSQRLWHGPAHPDLYQHTDHVRYGHWDYDCKGTNPQPHSWDHRAQTRSSSDADSDNGAFGQRHPRRIIVARGSGRIFHPIVGGAPFMTCCNCFELLKIPKKLMLIEKKQRRIRCGACSSIMFFEPEDRWVAVSFPTQIKELATEVDDGSGETLANLQDSYGFSNANVGNSSNCNLSFCKLQMTKGKPNFLSREQRSDCSDSEKRQDSRISSFSSPEEEQSPDSLIVQRDVSSFAELPSKDDVSPPLPDSHPLKFSDYASNNNVISRDGNGNKSKHIEQEKMTLDRTTSQRNSIRDTPVATEMEVSFNDFLDGGISQDSTEVIKEEDLPRITKRGEYFFVGLIKKSFRDFSKSGQRLENERSAVSVNGQLIPYRVVKKAEKLAGPIQSGDYWYDYQAGFWGVMGEPCLGIIPPLIEEFNYPMPESCAGGNTGIFVNGRELHQKDLDLLAGRGLPIMRSKYYLIEISGKVLDEQTGEELESLGKLAPTVERVGHGFGMKVPRVATK